MKITNCIIIYLLFLGQSFGQNCIMLFPNPAKDRIQVKSDQLIHSVSLFDISGKVLLYSESSLMRIDHLKAGIYILQVRLSNHLISRKVIVN